jgi:hypothetical protein
VRGPLWKSGGADTLDNPKAEHAVCGPEQGGGIRARRGLTSTGPPNMLRHPERQDT